MQVVSTKKYGKKKKKNFANNKDQDEVRQRTRRLCILCCLIFTYFLKKKKGLILFFFLSKYALDAGRPPMVASHICHMAGSYDTNSADAGHWSALPTSECTRWQPPTTKQDRHGNSGVRANKTATAGHPQTRILLWTRGCLESTILLIHPTKDKVFARDTMTRLFSCTPHVCSKNVHSIYLYVWQMSSRSLCMTKGTS